MQDFKKLDVWHKAHALTLVVYRATQQFPADDDLAYQARSGVQRRRYRRISLKAVGVIRRTTCGIFFKLPPVLPLNLNITLFSPMISDLYLFPNTRK
jgi:hypothetical protein